MATVTIPAGTQPVLKSFERPACATAGEALGMVVPVYKKASDNELYTADSVTTDPATSNVVGITVSAAEVDSQVLTVSTKGTVLDFGVALTKGQTYYLVGAGAIGLFSDITVGHQVVRIGYANEDTDLVIDIQDRGEVKT
jgi:hypothetical protein